MSIIIKFFVAPDRDAAAAVVQGGPDGVFESLTFSNFDAEEALIEWESIFTGRSFEELAVAGEPDVVADPEGGEGVVVLAASGVLQDALAAADERRLVEVSQLWVQERAADCEVFDWETATGILIGLADLARAIGGREDRPPTSGSSYWAATHDEHSWTPTFSAASSDWSTVSTGALSDGRVAVVREAHGSEPGWRRARPQ